MNNSDEQMQIEFHNRANAVYFSINKAFETAITSISRRNEEYKFQQLKKQFVVTLEQELQMTAKDILEKYKNVQRLNEIDQMFHKFINDYLHRFVQKINDL
jgi:hypothetical protein